MRVFPNHELRYYVFGLRAGVANLVANGWRLGLKKTVGKITQPINVPSRFPEYDRFASAIHDHLSRLSPERQVKILDVGSPKLLGLYLGHTTTADVTLTDISDLNVDEYRTMWRGLQPSARGRAGFSLQDARSLGLPAAEFDVVYSMSVVEHVEGEGGDSQAVSELIRVLKPSGLLVLSVPFGREYMEQQRIGFAGAARRTGDRHAYFFQRIYDPAAFRTRILAHANDLEQVTVTTVARRNGWLSRAFGSIGENLRGALGFMNPILSAALNTTRPGIDDGFEISYGPVHSARDVYGDLILVGRKRQHVTEHGPGGDRRDVVPHGHNRCR
jgi:SAM-dependent methyltransferase